MPDFGMIELHIGHARGRACDDEVDALLMAYECKVRRSGAGASLGAARNMDGKRMVEKSVTECGQLLGNRARRDVARSAGGTAGTGRNAQARVAWVCNQAVPGNLGLDFKAGGCLRKQQERATR